MTISSVMDLAKGDCSSSLVSYLYTGTHIIAVKIAGTLN